jgi:glycolate oxidase
MRGRPILVAYPTDKEQVLRMVKLANRENIPLVTRGGGSGLSGGAVPSGDVVVNLGKMNRILAVESDAVIVQPGITPDELNRRLKGKEFRVRPASHAIATIGGMIATDAGGEHVLRFGKMSDNVLGMEVVSGGGKLLDIGRRGLCRFAGTEGIGGIVVEAKLKIHPKIKRKSLTIRHYPDLRRAVEEVKRRLSDKNLIACEFINPILYDMAGRGRNYFLLFEYIGKKAEVRGKKGMEKYWKIREGCYDTLMRNGWKTISDPWIPHKNRFRFLAWCEKKGLPAFGHLGHGVFHVHLKNKRKMSGMYGLVNKLGGEVSGEHGIGMLKRKYLNAERREELRRLKKCYDPKGILNRGKVI